MHMSIRARAAPKWMHVAPAIAARRSIRASAQSNAAKQSSYFVGADVLLSEDVLAANGAAHRQYLRRLVKWALFAPMMCRAVSDPDGKLLDSPDFTARVALSQGARL
jgi:hypothetical protein